MPAALASASEPLGRGLTSISTGRPCRSRRNATIAQPSRFMACTSHSALAALSGGSKIVAHITDDFEFREFRHERSMGTSAVAVGAARLRSSLRLLMFGRLTLAVDAA